jgi:tetratricopeptide (TPR) repeat protein
LHIPIVENESARGARERPNNPDAEDLVLQALVLYNKPLTAQSRIQIVALHERAVQMDPSSYLAQIGLAEALLNSIPYTIFDDPAVPAKLRRAGELITRAEALRPDEKQVMSNRVGLLWHQDRCPEVIQAAQRAIQLHPELTGTRFVLGFCLVRNARAADAIPIFEQSIRVNPRSPGVYTRYNLIGYSLLFLERYDDAVVWFQKALAASPGDSAQNRAMIRAAIASAQALAGHTEDARANAAEASQLWPTITARSYFAYNITNPIALAQIERMRDGMRLAGIRDHADEDADPGVVSDDSLHSNYDSPTPTVVPGAQTIRTSDLAALIQQRRLLLLDVSRPWGRSIPGAIGLWGAGVGGSVTDEYQERLGKKLQQLTHGDHSMPVVTVGWNAERYQGGNLALRLVALGYNQVYWYRGGREAWEAAGLPQTDLVVQDW